MSYKVDWCLTGINCLHNKKAENYFLKCPRFWPLAPGYGPLAQVSHGMKANPPGYLWSKYECFLMRGCQDHTCHKLLTEICEVRQIFKGNLIKICEIFTKIALELPQNSQMPLFKCQKLVINTTKCDLYLFLHKTCRNMVWKFYEIWKFCETWKILWKLASRWARFYLTVWDMARMRDMSFWNTSWVAYKTFNAVRHKCRWVGWLQ